MNSQMNLFENEQDSNPSIAYRGASLASRTALQESVKRLVMNVIYGRKCGVSLAKLSPDGLWLKMSGDYCQAKMDGSFEEYSEILPTWGLMLDGVLIEPPMSERFMPESGLRLLPTPTAEQFSLWASAELLNKNIKTRKSGAKIGTSLSWVLASWHLKNGGTREKYPDPCFSEMIMGFPIGWTDGIVLETQ